MAGAMRKADLDRDQEQMGTCLREAREYLGLSQEFVAERLSVPRASISEMEAGKRKVSSLELRDLSRLYKRPVEYFLGEQEIFAATGEDTTIRALFRTTKKLSPEDRQQLIRFAEFLRAAGRGNNTRRPTRRSKQR